MFISLPLAIGACLLKKTALCHTMLKVSAISGTAWAAGGLYLATQQPKALPPATDDDPSEA